MANKLFYGVSTSQETADPKEITIYNSSDEIMPGDLLAVYFAHGNTESAPELEIRAISQIDGEENEEPASDDSGIPIKTHDITGEVDYMWRAGEVCLFVLTSEQFNSDVEQEYDSIHESAENNALHYMLIRGCRADNKWYGLTKLFTNNFPTDEGVDPEFETFDAWLRAENVDTDTTTAATPYLVKQLAQYILGNLDPNPEPSPTPTPTYIEYVPDGSTQDGDLIGILKVGDTEYEIKIPHTAAGGSTITYTHELINDADVVNGQHNWLQENRTEGSYFITDVVPEGNLYLHKNTNDPVGIYIATPTAGPYSTGTISPPVEGILYKNPLLIKDGDYTRLNYGYKSDPLLLYGTNINFYPGSGTDLKFLVAPGYAEFKGDTGYIKATNFMEGNKYLYQKYSKKLVGILFRLGLGSSKSTTTGCYCYKYPGKDMAIGRKMNNKLSSCTAAAKGTTGHQAVYITNGLKGLKPLALIGWNITDAENTKSPNSFTPKGSTGDATYQCLWELYLHDRRAASSANTNGSMIINYDSRNYVNRATYFVIDVYVLCEDLYNQY